MADKKISAFTQFSSIADGDFIVFDNISEANATRNALISFANFKTAIHGAVTTNQIPKVDGSDELVDSQLSDDGTFVTSSASIKISANIPTLQIKDANNTGGSGSMDAYLNLVDSGDTSIGRVGIESFYGETFQIRFRRDADIEFKTGTTSTDQMIIKHGGVINMPNLPTSSAGLASGDLWNNSNVVNIV